MRTGHRNDMKTVVLAVVGLAREARIAKRAGLVPIVGSGNSELLAQRLQAVVPTVEAIISFGIAGSLAPLLRVGDAVVATHVVTDNHHYACDPTWSRILRTKLPDARSAVIVGVDTPASHIAHKKNLFRMTGAHAVDMESHIAARFAVERGVPFVALRVISDGSERTLPPAALEPLKPSGKPRLFAVLRSIVSEPDQLPELVQTAREANAAFRTLLRCRHLLGAGLGCPYLG